jgi:GntR family transcriptional regulator
MLAAREFARAPLYRQVCDELSRRIADGTWKPHSALPNEGDLARELGVSTGTVRKALDKLEADRFVLRRQGRGTFVVDQASHDVANRFDGLRQKEGSQVVWQPELLTRTVGPSTALEQQRLQVEPEGSVLRLRRLWKKDGWPLMLEDASIAIERLPGFQSEGADDRGISAMAQKYGVHLLQAREQVTVEAATAETAQLLSVPSGTFLLRLDRIIHTSQGQPIEWRVGVCHLKDEYYFAQSR